MPKLKYYDFEPLYATDADYLLLLGKRSNGKSYAVKNKLIKRAWEDEKGNSKFVFVRRYEADLKPNLIDRYFQDSQIINISDNQCKTISCWNGKIYASNIDERMKIDRVKVLGYTIPLNLEQRYKSGSYLDCDTIIFEEVTSNEGYLSEEVKKLKSLVSTIARNRKIKVIMIGNTISRVCPYYYEWRLNRVPKQPQGTIDFYEHDYEDEHGKFQKVKIAVENCENTAGGTGQMFFGESDKMIMSGSWDVESITQIPHNAGRVLYTMVIKGMGFMFLAEYKTDRGLRYWYIQPKTTPIKDRTRVISDTDEFNPYYTKGIRALNDKERIIFRDFTEDRVFFSDALTASDFKNIQKYLRRSF